VWLIDTDEQGTLSQWHARREQDTPNRAEMPFARIAEGLANMAERGAAYCFIDTAPTISGQSSAVINMADLVLIPVRPSPADLWAVSETVALVKQAGKPFLVRHHSSQTTGHHHRPNHRRSFRAWPGCSSLHR
jgi:chromosome partitioning protein